MNSKAPRIDLAILGGEPAFNSPLPVGQINLPDWSTFESNFRDIFNRQYYTNQGPLAVELESRLKNFFGVEHVICMTNATLALVVSAKALGLTGKVICPAFTFAATAQSLSWAGLDPVFADIDRDTHQMSLDAVSSLIDNGVSAILGVHLWGNSCDPEALEELARSRGLQVYFDAAHAFGCSVSGKMIGNFGRLEVFSFHATKVLNAAEGGCVCTNDGDLASRIRNIRSSYGAGAPVSVPITANGRMSEAQAAMALMSLETYPAAQKRNQTTYNAYRENLETIPGIRVLPIGDTGDSNYQYVVIDVSSDEFGVSRDSLLRILKAENILSRRYFSPGLHNTVPYNKMYPQYTNTLPNTDRACKVVMQLPSGQGIGHAEIIKVCSVIRRVHENAEHLLQSGAI